MAIVLGALGATTHHTWDLIVRNAMEQPYQYIPAIVVVSDALPVQNSMTY